MARVETVSCDVCNVQKKDANHWWRIYRNKQGLCVVRHHAPAPDGDSLIVLDLCGTTCLMKKISELIDDLTR